MIDLRGAEEAAELERSQNIGDDIRADLPGFVDHHARAAGMFVAVPTASQIARRKDDARAAAEIDAFEAGGFGEGRAVAFLVGQIAEFVIGSEKRIVGQQLAERAAGEDQRDLAAETLGEIGPTAAGVADDRAAVHHIAGELGANFLGERELVVSGEQECRQFAGIEGKMLEIGLDRAVVDA